MTQYENSIIQLDSTKTKLVSQNVSYICYFQCHLGRLTSLSIFFFQFELNLSSIWAVGKTSRVIKTDGSEKSRAINKSGGNIRHQVCLVSKQAIRHMKLTSYSYCTCTFCYLHYKSLVLDGKWRRVNCILRNNTGLAGWYAREENPVKNQKNIKQNQTEFEGIDTQL